MADYNLLSRNPATESKKTTVLYGITDGVEFKFDRGILGGATLAYFINLSPSDVGDPELVRVAAAINASGGTGFPRTKGEDMHFYTFQQSRTDNTNIEQKFYKVKITDDVIGGSGGVQVTQSDIQPSGIQIYNVSEQPTLEIALGDIGTDDVEDAFNTHPDEPFTISGLKFITALQNDVERVWVWKGGDGEFGATGATRPAVDTDFDLLGVDEVPLQETTPIEGSGGLVPSNVIKLDNWEGREYFMGAASALTTYTYQDETLKGKARHLINAPSEPTITGATKINGDTFQANTDMYMFTEYNGVEVQYKFESIATLSAPITNVLNYSNTLTPSQIKTLNSIPIDAIPSVGAGKYIRIINAEIENLGGTAGYDSFYIMQLKSTGASDAQASSPTTILQNFTSTFGMFNINNGTDDSIKENSGVQITSSSDSSATGDFSVFVSIETKNLRDRVKNRTSKSVEFTMQDNLGAPIDITGATIEIDFRYNSKVGEIVKETAIGTGITLTDAVNGRFDLDSFLLDWEVGCYWYGVVITFPSGDIDENLQGKVTVLQNIPN